MIIRNANVYTDAGEFERVDVRVVDGKIVEIGTIAVKDAEEIDAQGKYLIPGLIETHFHGALDLDSSEGTVEAFTAFSKFMASQGITTFIPALISSSDEVTEKYIAAGNEFMAAEAPYAEMGGFYLEGPFISQKYKGAHAPAVLQNPDLDKFKRWYELAGGKIRKMVVAPELDGAESLIRWASTHGVAVEIGHTAANYEQAKHAIDWGVTLTTHAFNAMPPLHHREPSVLGAVLTDDRVTCELICDLGHVSEAVVKIVIACKGDRLVNVISDSCTAAGLGDGEYLHPDGRKMIVENGLAKLENGTIMGSASSVLDGVRNLVKIGIPLTSAIRMASTNPARTSGLTDRGSISVGKRADFVLLNEDVTVSDTIVNGKIVYEMAKQ